jgi:hypothetical protein
LRIIEGECLLAFAGNPKNPGPYGTGLIFALRIAGLIMTSSRLTILLMVGLGVLAGYSSRPGPALVAVPKRQLTLDQGQAALLKLMRSNSDSKLPLFNDGVANEVAKLPVEAAPDGWYTWGGAIRIRPSQAIYQMTIQPQAGAQACTLEYAGSFVPIDGEWIATAPTLVSSAMPGRD